ncbi:hypothetical protein C8J56DRAFT_1039190 [Mycena floridula]|nr:hypothetical protein C8J56DRAFT_1039190 [Mycena floridula]
MATVITLTPKDSISMLAYDSTHWRLVLAGLKTTLTCIDGTIGALVSANGTHCIVTTPNSDCILTPPIGTCSVSMKLDYHFGIHDPIIYPQPYVPNVAYLCAIPAYQKPPMLADSMKPCDVPFYIPQAEDFILKDLSCSWNKLGMLRSVACQGIVDLVHASTYDLKNLPHPTVQNDECTIQYDIIMQGLCQRLLCPTLKNEAFALLANLNRVYLKSQAHKFWLSVIEPCIACNDNKVHPVEPVVGAFTDDFDVANLLFHARIP